MFHSYEWKMTALAHPGRAGSRTARTRWKVTSREMRPEKVMSLRDFSGLSLGSAAQHLNNECFVNSGRQPRTVPLSTFPPTLILKLW